MAKALLFSAIESFGSPVKYFTADTDGTITELDFGSDGVRPYNVPFDEANATGARSVTFGDLVLWQARGTDASGSNVIGNELAISDGTVDGTVMVDITSGPGFSAPSWFETAGSLAYFHATGDGSGFDDVWVTDGTAGGTRLVYDGTTSANEVRELANAVADGAYYFQTGTGTVSDSAALWRAVDGKAELVDPPSTEVTDIYGYGIAEANGTVIVATARYSDDDPVTDRDERFDGARLYTVNESGSLTSLDSGWAQKFTQVTILAQTDERVVFSANTSFRDYGTTSLYTTDGTEAGTVTVNSGTGYAFADERFAVTLGDFYISVASDSEFTSQDARIESVNTVTGATEELIDRDAYGRAFGDMVAFADGTRALLTGASDAGEMWVTDGTAAGTELILDLDGPRGGAIGDITAVGDKMFFSATTDSHGSELWMTDGTVAGTMRLTDINPGSANSVPQLLGAVEVPDGGGQDVPTAGDDILYGTDSGDTIKALAGDDHVYGDGGNDRLFGQAGSDVLYGGNGKDKLFGGSGTDYLGGGSGKDTLKSGGGKDFIDAGGGKDTVKAGGGNDQVYGNGGKDRIDGGKGNDKLWGNGGKDKLTGGAGDEKMWGGSGKDVFEFDYSSNFGDDTIVDFELGSDMIEVTLPPNVQIALDVRENATGDAVITFGKNSITLVGQDAAFMADNIDAFIDFI